MTRTVLALVASLSLAACATERPSTFGPPVGTGWSRAPDLSVWAALDQAGELAREQDVLCAGRNPATVADAWRVEFGAREDWIEAALAVRYGADALADAERRLITREPCPTLYENRWRREHARLLRLLEVRLYPADYWRQLR